MTVPVFLEPIVDKSVGSNDEFAASVKVIEPVCVVIVPANAAKTSCVEPDNDTFVSFKII